LASEPACEVKTGVDVDRVHPFPGFFGHSERVISLVPRRRSAMYEVCHLPDG
jgi:hypothetical protein